MTIWEQIRFVFAPAYFVGQCWPDRATDSPVVFSGIQASFTLNFSKSASQIIARESWPAHHTIRLGLQYSYFHSEYYGIYASSQTITRVSRPILTPKVAGHSSHSQWKSWIPCYHAIALSKFRLSSCSIGSQWKVRKAACSRGPLKQGAHGLKFTDLRS